MARVRAGRTPIVGPLYATVNGTYYAASDNLDGYSSVEVDVQYKPPLLPIKMIDANGTYMASSESLIGYSGVVVNVPNVIPNIITDKVHFINNDGDTSYTFTATRACKVLALNMECIGEANTGHTTNPTIATTGTVKSSDTVYTTYGSNNYRDCTIAISIIELTANQTVTFSNISRSSYIAKMNMILEIGDYNTIDNTMFDTVTDNARDNTKTATGSGPALLLSAEISGTLANGMYSDIAYNSDVDKIVTFDSPGISITVAVANDEFTTTLSTGSHTNYVSKVYGVWSLE